MGHNQEHQSARTGDGEPSSRPLLLAIDTATSYASIALFDGARVLAESTWLAGRNHSLQVLPEIERLLARVNRQVEDLTGLVVAQGPGSFTGVRVGLSLAKGIAAGLHRPLWGVSTLQALAGAAGHPAARVRSVVEVGRGRVATSAFSEGAELDPPRLVAAAELADLVPPGETVVGDVPQEAAAALVARGIRVLHGAVGLRHAGLLAEVGWAAARSGAAGDPAAVDAIYLAR
jgi:tRNA threonylcarbamoyladenosine biosynthesis protein TsaB